MILKGNVTSRLDVKTKIIMSLRIVIAYSTFRDKRWRLDLITNAFWKRRRVRDAERKIVDRTRDAVAASINE